MPQRREDTKVHKEKAERDLTLVKLSALEPFWQEMEF